jgi:hypothetical protein
MLTAWLLTQKNGGWGVGHLRDDAYTVRWLPIRPDAGPASPPPSYPQH